MCDSVPSPFPSRLRHCKNSVILPQTFHWSQKSSPARDLVSSQSPPPPRLPPPRTSSGSRSQSPPLPRLPPPRTSSGSRRSRSRLAALSWDACSNRCWLSLATPTLARCRWRTPCRGVSANWPSSQPRCVIRLGVALSTALGPALGPDEVRGDLEAQLSAQVRLGVALSLIKAGAGVALGEMRTSRVWEATHKCGQQLWSIFECNPYSDMTGQGEAEEGWL